MMYVSRRQASKEARLDLLVSLLGSLEQLVSGLGSGAALELRRLVAREYALLARGVPRDRLLPLRRHISLLFGELVKSPEVNPEAARELHQVPETLNQGFFIHL